MISRQMPLDISVYLYYSSKIKYNKEMVAHNFEAVFG